MSFTDEDMKRLKSALVVKDPTGYWFPKDKIEALITRLEAAEKCVELCSTDENCCAIPEFGPKGNVPDAISWLEVWKKSAGVPE